jgi:hypothetical protein
MQILLVLFKITVLLENLSNEKSGRILAGRGIREQAFYGNCCIFATQGLNNPDAALYI